MSLFAGSQHSRAVLQALLVTFLWATSWVIIKIGLREAIPPLVFAGLRYTLAFCCLIPFVLRQQKVVSEIRQLRPRDLLMLVALGLLLYSTAQGAQFMALAYLPAISVNLLLSFTALIVAALGLFLLRESPTATQWVGLAIYLGGVAIYFLPVTLNGAEGIGIAAAVVCLLSNAVGTLLGRSLNRGATLSPLTVTAVSMGVGAPSLLIVGLITQGMPVLTPTTILIIIWLAVVNTAFAFTLWNKTLQHLSALESSIINNLMMVQIPVLAWLFLDEEITAKTGVGLILAVVGILTVQLRRLAFPGTSIRRSQAKTIEVGAEE